MPRFAPCRLLSLLALGSAAVAQGASVAERPWWSDAVGQSVRRAADNKQAIEAALRRVPAEQRESLAFLIAHMPAKDLRKLDADFLLHNVALAHQAIDQVPWGKDIPPAIFRNDVLPYASVSETREAWRQDFYDRFMPLVKQCKSPGEAAQVLNRKIFGILEVRYSTKRRRADQSPSESIEIGMASCTGLSILLVDACRAVGVPARLAGIPSWVNKRGNHTWVEIWDRKWHFTGAAEPSGKGLNHTWFMRDAALAKKDSRRNAIYAVSYARTAVVFPMVWARRADPVYAVNVTDRYTGRSAPTNAAGKRSRLMVRVRGVRGGERVVTAVRVVDTGDATRVLAGMSKGERNDTNDFLTFEIERGRRYEIRVGAGALAQVVRFTPSAAAEQVVDVALLSPDDVGVKQAAAAWFAADAATRAAMQFAAKVETALLEDEARVRALVWTALREAKIHADLRADLAANRVRSGEHVSPYVVKTVGKRPAGGWPLFIAMHGGGGAPQRVNDSQWRVMQRYYRDQKAVGGYLYLALRAPNNTWNGFYTHYVWPLITRLIRQFVICRDVDPDKVFLMGYSHGGYGAFGIGPNIPDRFAAVHSSAAAPTPGISPAQNLRNTIFTYMVGERDTRYGRLKRCRAFDAEIQKLRGDRDDTFPVTLEFKAGFGHGGLPDRDKIRTMYPATRRAVPRHLTWVTTGSTVSDFFWIASPMPKGGQQIEARCEDGNRIMLQTKNVARVGVALDRRLVDFGKPVHFVVDGVEQQRQVQPSMQALCASMLRRGDPALACTASVELYCRDESIAMSQPDGQDQDPQLDTDFIEGLVFQCLEADDVAAAAAALAAQHPEAASRLRRVLARLETEGLVADVPDTEAALHQALGPPRVDTDDIEAPERLGDFRILSRLGAGGMGVVYLAEDEKLGRQVAIKLVRPEQLYFPGARVRFEREIEAIARLHHPGIVTIHSVGEQDGVPYFSMDYVRGMSLSRLIAHLAGQNPARLRGQDFNDQLAREDSSQSGSSAQVSWTRLAVHLVRDVADALAHAHSLGVLHRDVKPSNILIGLDHRPRLLDFGLARTAGAQQITKSTAQLGSLPYMAPEQLETGAEAQTPALDVYALGVTLYELLTLRSPFLGATPEDTRTRILAAKPASPRGLNSAVSADLETVCLTAMEKSPARRYASMAVFIDDLDNLLERRPIVARPAGRLLRTWRWCQRHPTVAVALGMAALVFALVVQFAVQQRQTARATEATNYVLGITAASSQMDQSRTREALASLDLCPEKLRRFEWHFLRLRGSAHDQEYRGHTDRVRWIELHPKGQEFVSAANDGTVRFWRLDESAPLHTVRPEGKRRVELLCCTYSADGELVFVGGEDGRLHRWRRDGTGGTTLFADKQPIRRLAVDPGGRHLACGLADGRVLLLNPRSGELLAEVETGRAPVMVENTPLDQPVNALVFAGDGSTLLVGWLNQVQVCDVASRRQVAQIDHGEGDIVMTLMMARDGRRLLSGTVTGRVRIWNLETRKQLVASDPSRTMAINTALLDEANGRVLIAGDRGPIVVLDAAELRHLYTLQGHEGTVTRMGLSADQRTVLTSSYDGTIRRWDVDASAASRVYGRHQGTVRTLEATPDGRHAITGGADGRLRLWDLEQRSVRELLPGGAKGVRATSLAPDGRRLLVLTDSLFVMDLPAGGADAADVGSSVRVDMQSPGRVRLVGWSMDGARCIGASVSGNVWSFDPAGGRVLAHNEELAQSECKIRCLWVSEWDDRVVAGTSLGTLVVFRGANLTIERTISAHPRPIYTLAGDPATRTLVSGDYEGLLRFWDLEDGAAARPDVVWKDEVISSIGFDPASERMITSTFGRQIQIWDAGNMRRLLLLHGHVKGVMRARFTPDGSRILSVGMDGTLRVWDSERR